MLICATSCADRENKRSARREVARREAVAFCLVGAACLGEVAWAKPLARLRPAFQVGAFRFRLT